MSVNSISKVRGGIFRLKAEATRYGTAEAMRHVKAEATRHGTAESRRNVKVEATRALYTALGVVCVGLAIAGVFVPGLPTTVFVIAASYLFTRSSPSMAAWLERHRWLGPPLQRFRQTRGMPARSKAVALVSMWIGVSVSAYTLGAVSVAASALVVVLALIGTGTILFSVRTTAARQSLILS